VRSYVPIGRGARQRGAAGRQTEVRKEDKRRMPNKSRALTRRPLWIITSYENNQMDALTIGLDLDGGFLAVFSFEEEAEAFLCLLGDDEKKKKGWQSEQTTAGGLVSVLLGPCADVNGVALDPLPLPLGRAMLPLISMSRGPFFQYLWEERRGVAGELAPSAS
jgi:hypothetical protein